MAAQRAADFSPDETEQIRRRMWMVMAAAGIFEKKDLATVVGVSASTAGRWLAAPEWAILYRFAKALRGMGDVTDDFAELRDFLELREARFPWASTDVDSAPVRSTKGRHLSPVADITPLDSATELPIAI